MQFELWFVCNSCIFDIKQLSLIPLSVEKDFIFFDSFRSLILCIFPCLAPKPSLISQPSALRYFKTIHDGSYKACVHVCVCVWQVLSKWKL